MAQRESCVVHPAQEKILFIREHYVKVFDGDIYKAALVALFEYLTNCELSRFDNHGDLGYLPWVTISMAKITDWMMGICSTSIIQRKLAELDSQGILKSVDPGGKSHKNYLLNVSAVQALLNSGVRTEKLIGKSTDHVDLIGKNNVLTGKSTDQDDPLKALGVLRTLQEPPIIPHGGSERETEHGVSLETERLIFSVAKTIHDNHPRLRRDCSIPLVSKKLKEILRYRKKKSSEISAYLASITENHRGWAKSEAWTKNDGEFSKGLANWLAKTELRYEQPPPDGPKEPRRLYIGQ